MLDRDIGKYAKDRGASWRYMYSGFEAAYT